MDFKKLVFEQNEGDWFAETFHNVLTIFKRKIVVVNEETLVTSLKDSDTFVLLCFGSVFEFKTFEEAEIKANEENQKHLEKTLQELEKYIDFAVLKLTTEEYEEISKKFDKNFEIGRVE